MINSIKEELLIQLTRLLSFITRRQIVHFIHVRKSGGTAIKQALGNGKKIVLIDKYIFLLHSHNFKLGQVRQSELCFFFLRNPLSRFVSGFNSRRRMGRPANFYPYNSGEKEAFSFFKTPNDLAISLSSKNSAIKQRAVRAMKEIRHVNTKFEDWDISPEMVKLKIKSIVHIGFQPNLSADYELIMTKLGIPLSHDLQLPVNNAQSHRAPKTETVQLEQNAIINLTNWYRDDFACLTSLGFLI